MFFFMNNVKGQSFFFISAVALVALLFSACSDNKHDGYLALLWTSSRGTGNDYTMDGVFFETQTLEARAMTYYDTWDYLSIRCVRD